MKEEFVSVDRYEGKYLISNYGNVYSYKSEKYLKVQMDKDKYPYVDLWNNGERKHKRVHILVAKAFILNPENKPQVNHMDGNKFNFRSDNLEWMTEEENIEHAVKNGFEILNNFRNKSRIANEEQKYYANHPG
jgi:hypothetical protein